MGAIVGFLRAGFGGGNGSDFEGVRRHTWGCLWGMLPVDIGGGEFVGWPLRVSGGASGAFLCPPPPVLVHMSMGFMMLALALCIVLLFTMGLSFWPFLRRLIKVDLVFSFLSFSIGKCQLGGVCPPLPSIFPLGGGLFPAFRRCISEFLSCHQVGLSLEVSRDFFPTVCILSSPFSVFPGRAVFQVCVCILVMDSERGCPVSLLFLGVLGSLSSLVSVSGPTRVQGS